MSAPKNMKNAEPPPSGPGPVSRRDFIATTAATGFGMGVTQSAPALAAGQAQGATDSAVARAENALPAKAQPREIYQGTAAGAVVAQLKAAGIRTLFHTNTSGFVPLWEAIHKAGDIQVINVTHEGQAVAAAAGYTMAGGKLGFFFGSDAGVGNAMSNIYNAWKDRVPLLVSFSGGALEEQGKDGFESWDDLLGPTRPFTLWTATLLTDDMTDIIRRAIKYAFGPPTGPVTLAWGEANQAAKVEAPIYDIDLASARHRPRAQRDVIEKAAQWLAEASHPVFVVGPEVTEDGAADDMRQLAEKLAVPVAETKDDLYDNFPNDHPLFLGQLESMRFPRQADLVVSFGEHFRRRGHPLETTPTVHISHDPDILGRPAAVDLAILSDVRSAIRDLSGALDSLLTKDRIERIRAARFAEISAFTAKLKQAREMALRARFDRSPLTWERVGYELDRALDRDAVIVPELGSQYYKVLRQLTFGGGNKKKIGRTSGSALGWGVGAALGVNLALPDRQVVSLQGDGGFLFGQSETLWSIARYESPMLIVIMNNHVYNESRDRNLNNGGLFLELGRDYNGYLGNPDVDFTKLAEAYSLKGEKVRNAGELAPALQRALRTMRDGKAVVLDIEIAPDGPHLTQDTWYQRHSIADIRKKRNA
jgi:thiamine pyrophosphate-dependent acetolactate synthase large subunit-like protein